MPRLTAEQRERAIGMLQLGASHSHVATIMGCCKKTITRLMTRFRATGRTADRPRTGRPPVTTPQEDRYLRVLHLRNRFLTVTSSAATSLAHQVSRRTLSRRLRRFGIRAYRPFRGMTLTREHRRRRLAWARTVRQWQPRNWRRVLFSDESRFQMNKADGRVRVYRRRNERTARCCVQEVEAFGGGSVMVWGGICGDRKTDLLVIEGNLTARRYIDVVLRPIVLPFVQQNQGTLFQQDNATPHTAVVTRNFLNNNNVNVLPWPARSPDLSPIEHLWDHLGRRVQQRQHPPQTRNALAQALQEEWRRIPYHVIRRLVHSARRRVAACIAARGGHTRY